MKRIIYLVFFLLLKFTAFSQNATQTISGTVFDGKTKEPLPYVNVVLYSLPDTTYVTGTATDEKGNFELNADKNAYVLKISMLGYQPSAIKVVNNQLGTISLSQSEEMLKEVVVTGHTPRFKMENNGITADVQNTPLKNMGNLSEVLGQMPFVIKDDNDFTVLGKGTPIIYINNRLVRDNSDLQRLNSKDIKKVTVITNPGAEYDSSVKAVIKIETLRPQGDGFGGEVYTYDQYNSKWYTRDGVALTYRIGGLDIFGNFDYADMNLPKRRTRTNNIDTGNTPVSVITKSQENDRYENLTPQIGFNYVLNENHSFGAKYQYYNSPDWAAGYSMNTDVFLNNQLDQELKTYLNALNTERSHYVNAYYNGKLSPLFSVHLDMDYKKADNGYNTAITNVYQQGDSLVKTYGLAKSTLYAGRLTIGTPVLKGSLSYGLEGSRTLNDQLFSVLENTGVPGIESSSNNVEQNLWAAFISYSKSFGLFSGNAGLRYEDVSSKYYQDKVLVAEQSKEYKRLFPSASISYNGKIIQMQLGYRNSVNRPSYDNLKSSVYFLSPYIYSGGNPLLMPAYTNSLSYMLKWRYFVLMTSYDWNNNYIAGFVPQLYMDNYMLLKPVNIANTNHLSVNLNYSTTWFKIWRPNWDVSLQKDYIELGNPVVTFNTPYLYANLKNDFKLGNWQLGFSVITLSKGNRDASYIDKASFSTNIYVNRNFFNNKLQVNIRGNNIFNTINEQYTYSNYGLSSVWDNYTYRRMAVLEIHYRFNLEQKSRYKGNKSTNELNRF